jgi:tetratricopeptide (TPR) repeat protein
MASPGISAGKWLLQIRRGELRLIQDLSELIRLVLERRVDRQALLYPLTEEPRSIGEMPELAELFNSEATPAPKLAGSDSVGGSDGDSSFGQDEVPYLDTISPLGSTEDAFGDYYAPPRRRAPAVLGVLALVAAVGGGAYYLALQRNATPAVAVAASAAPAAPTPAPAPTPPPALPPPVAAQPPAPTPPAPAPAPAAPAAAVAPIPTPAPAPAAAAAVSALPPWPEAKAEAKAEAKPEPKKAAAAAPAKAVALASTKPATEIERPAPTPAPRGRATREARAEAGPAPRPAPAAEPKPAGASARSYQDLVREGDQLIEAGKTNKALALFEEANRVRPDGAAALAGMAYAWLDRGDTRRAVSLFQRAVRNDGNYAPALFGLGEAYREQGQRGEAVETFRRYVSRFPSDKEANAARRQVEQLSGGGGRR